MCGGSSQPCGPARTHQAPSLSCGPGSTAPYSLTATLSSLRLKQLCTRTSLPCPAGTLGPGSSGLTQITAAQTVAAEEKGSRGRWLSGWQMLKIETHVSDFAPSLPSLGLCARDTVPHLPGPLSLLTR